MLQIRGHRWQTALRISDMPFFNSPPRSHGRELQEPSPTGLHPLFSSSSWPRCLKLALRRMEKRGQVERNVRNYWEQKRLPSLVGDRRYQAILTLSTTFHLTTHTNIRGQENSNKNAVTNTSGSNMCVWLMWNAPCMLWIPLVIDCYCITYSIVSHKSIKCQGLCVLGRGWEQETPCDLNRCADPALGTCPEEAAGKGGREIAS